VTGEDGLAARDVAKLEGHYRVPDDTNVLFIASGSGGPGSRVRLARP